MTPAELARAQISAILTALETTRTAMDAIRQYMPYSDTTNEAIIQLDVDLERLRNLVVLGAR